MSKVEQYRFDGSVKPDFQSLPTLVRPAEDLSETEAAEYTAFLKEKAAANLAEIASLQKALREAGKRGLLVILQGMPYSGRSETSKYLKNRMIKGVKLCSYKQGETSHDFLWQMHRRIPKYGKICIMSGSVYSEIQDGEGRTLQVKEFEKYLKDSGISVIRVFLHVSGKRQKKRMLEVITTKPGGAPRDLPTDKEWRREYLDRFADTIGETASPEAPWYIVPADSKWYARCIVTELIRDELRECVSSQETEAAEEVKSAEAKATAEEKPAEVTAEDSAEEKSAEAKEKPAEAEPEDSAEEKSAEAESAKKPVKRTRRRKTGTAAEAKETAPSEETVPIRKSAPRRQGPPKTVEETLARRRRRSSSAE